MKKQSLTKTVLCFLFLSLSISACDDSSTSAQKPFNENPGASSCADFSGTYENERGHSQTVVQTHESIQFGESAYFMELDGNEHHLYSAASNTHLYYTAFCSENSIFVSLRIVSPEGYNLTQELEYRRGEGYYSEYSLPDHDLEDKWTLLE